MFCSKCGKEIHDAAVICVGCGCSVEHKQIATNSTVQTRCEKPTLLTAAVICAILCSVAGLILSIIGLSSYSDTPYRRPFTKTLLVSCVFLVISFILFIIYGDY